MGAKPPVNVDPQPWLNLPGYDPAGGRFMGVPMQEIIARSEQLQAGTLTPKEKEMQHRLAELGTDQVGGELRLTPKSSPNDKVIKPAHYEQFEIEPISFIMRNKLPFWLGNVVKYGCRAGAKIYDGMSAKDSEITDIKKMIRYCEMRLNQLNGKEPNDA